MASGYRIAARFGQVGIWSRYHTGFDFSAPVGTPIRAPAAGVVTNAGIGPASGWAGNYVAIRYPDGTYTLMAHMSTVSVSVGQTVSACQLVGAVGMTGRTFGPHLHFEVYPAGVTPGDLYSAVNPLPWLNARGLTRSQASSLSAGRCAVALARTHTAPVQGGRLPRRRWRA